MCDIIHIKNSSFTYLKLIVVLEISYNCRNEGIKWRIGVTKWIEAICLHYDLTDRRIELYLRQFFRLIGVYTYEWPVNIKEKIDISPADYFADIVILSEAYIQGKKHFLEDYLENTIWIIIDKKVNDRLEEIGALKSKNVIFCDFTHRRECIIPNLINCLKKIYEVKYTDEHSFFFEWEIVGQIYVDQNIWEHMYICESFIPDDKLFRIFSNVYSNTVDKILEQWRKKTTSGDYFKYAVIYIAYSLNLYCKRSNDKYEYRIKNLKELIESLVLSMKNNRNAVLLQAKIQNNLLEETQNAKALYQSLIEKDSANWGDIYYDMGMISEEKDHNYLEAMKYYQKAIRFLSEKYNTVDRIAKCWNKMGEKSKAISAWQEVSQLLMEYFHSTSMSLVETKYLCESALAMGNVWIEDKRTCENAKSVYELAELVCEMIDFKGMQFLENMLEQYSLEQLKVMIKKSLDKIEILRKIYYVYVLQGNNKTAQEYLEKIRKEETEEE